MKQKRYSEEQINQILKEAESGPAGGGCLPQTRGLGRQFLHLAQEVWRDERE